MMPLASRAARRPTSSSFALICARIAAASVRSRAASASASTARAPSVRWLAVSEPFLHDVRQRDRHDEQRQRRRASPARRACCRTVASRDWCAASGAYRFPQRPQHQTHERRKGVHQSPAMPRCDPSERGRPRRIDRLDRHSQSLFEAATRRSPPLGAAAAAAEERAREALPRQPVLVVHRRLVDQVGDGFLVAFGPVAEEDDVARRAGSRSTCTPAAGGRRASRPWARRRHRGTDSTTLKRREIDEARLEP